MKITIEHDGEILVCELHPKADYYEALGIAQGMIGEFLDEPFEEDEELDG